MTTIPNIPTDNYYKFLSISGITIIMISIIFCYVERNNLINEIENIELHTIKLNLETKFLQEDSFKLDNEMDSLQKN